MNVSPTGFKVAEQSLRGRPAAFRVTARGLKQMNKHDGEKNFCVFSSAIKTLSLNHKIDKRVR